MQKWYEPDVDLFLRHRNAGASEDLLIPVHLVCNTPDEVLMSQIAENSRAKSDWLKVTPAHSGIAVLCGSGPSLADTLDDVRRLQKAGGKVFALNGAARYLADNGIMPDYQVIVDAREQTRTLIGPAKEHLFASQVHPSLFHDKPGARLWHLWIGDEMDKHLPEYGAGYVLVGGTAAVGNCATCLAYAMGFRDLHCFGYDASHRGAAGHAFSQPMNATEPITRVSFRGTNYLVTYTMKSAADTFMLYGRALMDEGATLTVYGDGLLPAMWRARVEPKTAESEAAKYAEMWTKPEYRVYSPGEEAAPAIRKWLGDPCAVIDFGCGTGRLTAILGKHGYSVTGIDHVDVRETEVPFVKATLWGLPKSIFAEGGVCCDVMEHIPPERVDEVLSGISRQTRRVYFTISDRPDSLGSLIGEQLHLTVQPYEWWQAKLSKYWHRVEQPEPGHFTVEEPKWTP